jgi:sigma-B regulation protein RsbU (phosphoserine phosphatase)
MIEGITLEERRVGLGRNDLLLLYTDGISEATNREQEFYGADRLLATLRDTKSRMPQASPEQTIKAVLASVSAFVGETLPDDDITLVALRRMS